MIYNFHLKIKDYSSIIFKYTVADFEDIDYDFLKESYRHAYMSSFPFFGNILVSEGTEGVVDLKLKMSLYDAKRIGEDKLNESVDILKEAVIGIAEDFFEQYSIPLELVEF